MILDTLKVKVFFSFVYRSEWNLNARGSCNIIPRNMNSSYTSSIYYLHVYKMKLLLCNANINFNKKYLRICEVRAKDSHIRRSAVTAMKYCRMIPCSVVISFSRLLADDSFGKLKHEAKNGVLNFFFFFFYLWDLQSTQYTTSI
jgi:hypothetical protein